MNSKKIVQTFDYAIGYESATLLNLRLDVSSVHVGIKNPQRLITCLQLRTSLSLLDGCGYDELLDLSREIVATCYCGHQLPQPVEITVEFGETSPLLAIGVGPYSMYMSDIHIQTRTNETFRELFDRVFKKDNRLDYLVALAPISQRKKPDMGEHLRHLGIGGHASDGSNSSHAEPHIRTD